MVLSSQLLWSNLNGADLTGANFSGASLNGSTFTGATWSNATCRTGPSPTPAASRLPPQLAADLPLDQARGARVEP
ncbi:MAG: pentapeptide repeat-containing protein [Candidatus Nanopelagicales bacterium]